MFHPRFPGPPCGPVGFHDPRGCHSHRPPFRPPPFMGRGGFAGHRPHGPHNRPLMPHHHPFGPPPHMCPLFGGHTRGGRGRHGMGSAALIAATYFLGRHMWHAVDPHFQDDLEEFVPPYGAEHFPPRPVYAEPRNAEKNRHAESSDHHMDEDEKSPRQPNDEAEEQEQLQTCDMNSDDLWVAVGSEVWTVEVALGPFAANEVKVDSDGQTSVEVHAAHYHGDCLVASMMHRLPPPPCAAPFTISHAHTPPIALITARKALCPYTTDAEKDLAQPNADHTNEKKM
ncbi:uncharacterized protein LOC121859157 [Homarus americanus]|uniref:Uncharacterized protein n=1 Tax=Homarus americanus TaxID=6706 RepID=A0A8J5N7J5_HOMAM|nr:uncharacterized protein LOC121859157 [Homarus americanus]KAG7174667.1 hypothetical protein Hamer_G015803 [Homarus americanus]